MVIPFKISDHEAVWIRETEVWKVARVLLGVKHLRSVSLAIGKEEELGLIKCRVTHIQLMVHNGSVGLELTKKVVGEVINLLRVHCKSLGYKWTGMSRAYSEFSRGFACEWKL